MRDPCSTALGTHPPNPVPPVLVRRRLGMREQAADFASVRLHSEAITMVMAMVTVMVMMTTMIMMMMKMMMVTLGPFSM